MLISTLLSYLSPNTARIRNSTHTLCSVWIFFRSVSYTTIHHEATGRQLAKKSAVADPDATFKTSHRIVQGMRAYRRCKKNKKSNMTNNIIRDKKKARAARVR